jgi:chemotaxis-related protein WspD
MSAGVVIGFQDAEPIAECWSRVGITGDRSCARLQMHVHCRNCPVYSNAAVEFLDREVSADHVAEWTRVVARAAVDRERDTESIVIFRLGPEWLGMRTDVFAEIATPRAIHTVPHRRSPVLRGVVNLHGGLVTYISLAALLGVDTTVQPKTDLGQLIHPRLIVLQRGRERVAAAVDEVHAVHRFHPRDVRRSPSTVSGAAASYTRGILGYLDRSVGLLDELALFRSVDRHFA